MIAAVLGNSTNRYNFSCTFWWDKDFSFNVYLSEVCGTPQIFEIKDSKTGKIIKERLPQIIAQNSPPHNHGEALNNWREARTNFQNILNEVNLNLADLEKAEVVFQYLSPSQIPLSKKFSLKNPFQKF